MVQAPPNSSVFQITEPSCCKKLQSGLAATATVMITSPGNMDPNTPNKATMLNLPSK